MNNTQTSARIPQTYASSDDSPEARQERVRRAMNNGPIIRKYDAHKTAAAVAKFKRIAEEQMAHRAAYLAKHGTEYVSISDSLE
jgi:hypothetical protein